MRPSVSDRSYAPYESSLCQAPIFEGILGATVRAAVD
jgi:hypothetical protein